MATTRLMAANEHYLKELPKGGQVTFRRSVLVTYSMLEWLEFEKAFRDRAYELGLDLLVEDHLASGSVRISWRPREI